MDEQIAFHRDTPQAVQTALRSVMNTRRRVRLFFGDTLTGRAWAEEFEVLGTIGRSCGKVKIPLLIKSERSMGGGHVMDHCIVAIQTGPGTFLYQHPLFHTGIWETGPAKTKDYALGVYHNGELHAQFKRDDQAEPYIAFMKGERWSKAPPPGSIPADESLPAIYLRREPTTDETLLRYRPDGCGKQDVVAYWDAACTKRHVRWGWHQKTKPRRNRSTLNLSFRNYRAIWLPDLTKRAVKAAAKLKVAA